MNDEKDKDKGLEINVEEKIKVSEVPYGEITTSSSGVSVTASGIDDIDREYYFPTSVVSGEIATTTSTDLGIELQPEEQAQFVESLDIAKTYVSEMEIGLSLKGIKFKIKREPKTKIIKFYKE